MHADLWTIPGKYCIMNCCHGNCDQSKRYVPYGNQEVLCTPKTLQEISMTILQENISFENALDVLICADVLKAHRLLRKVKDFIGFYREREEIKTSFKCLQQKNEELYKTCLEIMLEVKDHVIYIGRHYIDYSFNDRRMTLEDICLLTAQSAMEFTNALPIMMNCKRLGAKDLFEYVTWFMKKDKNMHYIADYYQRKVFTDNKLSLEDIWMLIYQRGLTMSNVLHVLINSNRLKEKQIKKISKELLWINRESVHMKERLKYLQRKYPKLFLEVGMIMMEQI